MLKKLKLLPSLLLGLLSISRLHGNSEGCCHNVEQECLLERSALYYLKLGITDPPADSPKFLPTLGLGARFQKGHHGFDLSASLSSMMLYNYFSMKQIFLYYPLKQKNHPFYLGLGPGVGFHFNAVPNAGSHGASSSEWVNLNLEGLMGMEFRHAEHLKTFIQVELSQPICTFATHREDKYIPGVALVGGFGF
jgi:hypothetical protein